MTNDLKDLVPAQEKLEWVTPKISLMDTGDTESKGAFLKDERLPIGPFNSGPLS